MARDDALAVNSNVGISEQELTSGEDGHECGPSLNLAEEDGMVDSMAQAAQALLAMGVGTSLEEQGAPVVASGGAGLAVRLAEGVVLNELPHPLGVDAEHASWVPTGLQPGKPGIPAPALQPAATEIRRSPRNASRRPNTALGGATGARPARNKGGFLINITVTAISRGVVRYVYDGNLQTYLKAKSGTEGNSTRAPRESAAARLAVELVCLSGIPVGALLLREFLLVPREFLEVLDVFAQRNSWPDYRAWASEVLKFSLNTSKAPHSKTPGTFRTRLCML